MNTTVEALKALYVAMGGTADDVSDITLIPDMINAIADLKSTDPDSNLVSEYSYAGHLDHYYIDGVLDQTTEHTSRAWLYEYDENDPDGDGHGHLISENGGTLTSGEQYIFEVQPEEDFEVDSIKLVDGSGNVLQDNLSNNTAFTLNNVTADSIYADIKCVGTSNNDTSVHYLGFSEDTEGIMNKIEGVLWKDEHNSSMQIGDEFINGNQYKINVTITEGYELSGIRLIDSQGDVLQDEIENDQFFTLDVESDFYIDILLQEMEHECTYEGVKFRPAGLTIELFEYDDNLNTPGDKIFTSDNLYENMQYVISISYDSSLYHIDSISLVDYAENVLQSGITNNTAFTLSSTAFAADEVYISVDVSDVDPDPEPDPEPDPDDPEPETDIYSYEGASSGSDSVDVLNLYEYDEDDTDGFGTQVHVGDDLTVGEQYIFEIQSDDAISSISLIDSDDDVIQTGISNETAFTLAQGEYTDSEVYVLITTESIEPEPPDPVDPEDDEPEPLNPGGFIGA